MPIRLKIIRKQQERARKISELMQMFNVNPSSNSYQYQPIGASNITPIIDPRIQKTKDLFEMYHLVR